MQKGLTQEQSEEFNKLFHRGYTLPSMLEEARELREIIATELAAIEKHLAELEEEPCKKD